MKITVILLVAAALLSANVLSVAAEADTKMSKQITDRIENIIANLDGYRVVDDQRVIEELAKQQSPAFEESSTVEPGHFIQPDHKISLVLIEDVHDYTITLFLTNISTGEVVNSIRRSSLSNESDILEYDIYDMIRALLNIDLPNTRRDHDSLLLELRDIKDLVNPDKLDYNIQERVAYIAIGVGYSYSSLGSGIGGVIGFRYRDKAVLGINYQFNILKETSGDIDDYFSYSRNLGSYTKDYSIVNSYGNDFYINYGWPVLSFNAGVSMLTYVTDEVTDMHSLGTGYGHSKSNDNRFTAAGYLIGLTFSPRGNRAYYNFSVNYRYVYESSIACSFSIEI